MEDFDNVKTKDLNECVVTDLNSYLTYISDIKETIKKWIMKNIRILSNSTGLKK